MPSAPAPPLQVHGARNAVIPAPPARPRGDTAAGVDLVLRAGRFDPMLRLGHRLPITEEWGLAATGGLSGSQGGSVSVTEAQLVVGPSRLLVDRPRLQLSLTPAIGGLLHRSAGEGTAATRASLLASFIGAASMPLSRHFAVEARVAPGMAWARYTHMAGNEVAWHGSRLRIEVGLALVFRDSGPGHPRW
jgi:hypothetical protein